MKPETNEKGQYLALLYDKKHGRLTCPYKIRKFNQLKKKYENLSR